MQHVEFIKTEQFFLRANLSANKAKKGVTVNETKKINRHFISSQHMLAEESDDFERDH